MSAISAAPSLAAPARSFKARRGRKRLAKAGFVAAGVAAGALTLSSCSPSDAVWYPLGAPGQVSRGLTAYHSGADIFAPYGTPVHASTAGVVSQAGWWYGYGNYTCIVRDATFKSCYAHQSAIFVSPGQRVTPGQTIGLVGATGNATGPHLHFEIYRYGRAVDPLPYLPPR